MHFQGVGNMNHTPFLHPRTSYSYRLANETASMCEASVSPTLSASLILWAHGRWLLTLELVVLRFGVVEKLWTWLSPYGHVR
jgi:hypothetical protein